MPLVAALVYCRMNGLASLPSPPPKRVAPVILALIAPAVVTAAGDTSTSTLVPLSSNLSLPDSWPGVMNSFCCSVTTAGVPFDTS